MVFKLIVYTFVVRTIKQKMKLEQELKMTKFENAEQRDSLNVVFTGAWISDRTNSLLKPFGISEHQFNVLRIVRGQKGNPINMLEVQERMIYRTSNTTRMVEKLKQKGLLIRQECAENRRKVDIFITDAGLELLDRIEPTLRNNGEKMFENLSVNESTQLADLLDKLRG